MRRPCASSDTARVCSGIVAPRTYNARCIVLGKTKLGETDAVLTMLDSEGHQVRAVGKGVRKPGNRFGARLEPFSEVDLHLHRGKSLDIVSEARTVATNAACREDLDRTAACSVVAEFLAKVTRDADVEPRLFALTEVAFKTIATEPPQAAGLMAAAHLLKAFAMLGVRPALRECALCGREVERQPAFDISAGGALCGSCTAQRGAGSGNSSALVPWLDAVLHATFAELASYEGAPVRPMLDFCESWCLEHLSVNIRSFAFLKASY